MKLVIFVLFLLCAVSVSAESVTLKLVNFPHVTGEFDGWFEIPNFIIIYNVNKLSDQDYHDLLVHEYYHYLAWRLWKIHPQDHSRFLCGNYGVYNCE